MDNDNKVIRLMKQKYKAVKFKFDYRGINIVNEDDGNLQIRKLVSDSDPAMIARCGATEMRCIDEYLSTGTFSKKIKKEISELSGVFPATDDVLKKFCEFYMECVSQSDILALWGVGAEHQVVKERCTNTVFTKLTALEPYYFENPWSVALKDKKVLVVHPFNASIKQQYENRAKLFDNPAVFPDFRSIICVKAVQSIAGQKTEFDTWFDALDYMKNQIKQVDFDVAIIGAGAYGLPLAAYVKSLGKISVQMSGATQILFGIKGKRWEQIPEISKFFNEYWIRPSDEETPEQSKKVEGGSYW